MFYYHVKVLSICTSQEWYQLGLQFLLPIDHHQLFIELEWLLLYLYASLPEAKRDMLVSGPVLKNPFIHCLRNRKHVPCFYRVLYNNPSYSGILNGSRLWSIRGQTHNWHHHYKVFPSDILKRQKVLRIGIIFYVTGQKIKYKKVLPRHWTGSRSQKMKDKAISFRLVRQSQIVQSVMQDCQYVLSHLLPVFNLLVQGSKITYNYYLSRRF